MDGFIFKTFIVEFFLLTSILMMLLYNAFLITDSQNNFPIVDKEAFTQSAFIIIISLSLSIGIDFGGITDMHLFINDISAISTKSIILVAVLGALICGQPYFVKKNINLYEYFVIVLLAIFSLLFLATASDLITIYLCLEMQSLCFYILAAFNRHSVFSTEAGLKYFVLGAFSSCIFLLGASLLYGTTGTTNLANYALLFSDNMPHDIGISFFIFGVIFLLITLLFKLTAAPFHIWSPDVYEGAPLNSSIIFLLVPKIVFLVLIIRVIYFSFYGFFALFQNFFFFCGILSVLLGSVLALQQKRFKKLLIYSSISHVGFLLLSLSTGTLTGIMSVYYYMIFYIITGFLIWGILVLCQTKKSTLYLTDLSLIAKDNPAMALALALGLFSLAGIPPLVGFSMKLFIFLSSIEAHLFEVSIIIILLSAIGAFYYLRVIKIMYFEKKSKNIGLKPIDYSLEWVYVLITISLLFIVFGFFNPTLFLLYAYKISLGFSLL